MDTGTIVAMISAVLPIMVTVYITIRREVRKVMVRLDTLEKNAIDSRRDANGLERRMGAQEAKE